MRTSIFRIGCAICFALLANAAGAECGPTPGGPPSACTPDAPASIGANGGADAGVGNPINVMTGNKYQREEDMPALPGVLGLEIVRHYNSAYSKPGAPNGPMGREWKLSYETELFDKFGRIQILQADGARLIFNRDPNNPDLCSTALPANGRVTLARQPDGTTDYTWTWPDGRRLHFNRWGKLDSITAATGEALALQYDPDQLLVRVTDPQGRSLRLGYLDRASARAGNRFRGVQTIDSPVGRFVYDYGGAAPQGAAPFDARILWSNMARVRLPGADALSRLYHHEDPRFPWLLTGISIETTDAGGKPVARRYATFGYDDNGRANLSTHAGGVDKVALDIADGGKTVLTNSLGQRTVYRHAIVGGEHRLLEVRGAGCATCGETNVRYGYDRLGRLTEATKLNTDGEPVSAVRSELDKLGRVVRVGKIAYRNGKPGPAQWRLRLEYPGDGAAPNLIARPSVVPGRERQTRIAYNLAGQPLSVTELGWIPSYDGRQAAAQMTRTTGYQYAIINGRSLLTRIDGPLPNGPANSPLDSDVTVFEYDHRPDSDAAKRPAVKPGTLGRYDENTARRDGLLTRITAPGNLVTEVLARDGSLRPTQLRITDGDLTRLATIHSNWRGQPEDIELVAGPERRRLHYGYDAEGHLRAVTRPGNLRITFDYDSAGRVSRMILPDGSGVALAHDTEDRATSVTRYDDMARTTAPALSSIRFDYSSETDRPSRLTAMADALGPLKSYRHNDIGQLVAITNALGTSTALEYDADARLASRTDAAGSADAASVRLAYDAIGQATTVTSPNGVSTLRRHDDFGLKVFDADPDRGVTLYRYDAAGRLLARIDETQSTTRYTYDHAGRLLAVGKDKIANLLQYRYRGSRLAGMVSTTDGDPAHATERLAFEYDAMGQLTMETRWLADVRIAGGTAAKSLRFVTRYEYDEVGRLVHQILPDGHHLRYRFTASGEVARRRSGQLEAILFDDRIVVGDIEQTIAGGLTGYTMSNGARQQIRLDGRGRIEQLHTFSGAAGTGNAWWRGIASWLPAKNNGGQSTLYRQLNRFDAAGRLVQVERQLVPGGRPMTRRETYSYDKMDRLTGITGKGEQTTFRYDAAGNRLAETSTTAGDEAKLQGHSFHYARGGNWLLAATQATTDESPPTSLRDAWFYHPTGLPLARLQRPANANATNRRVAYNSDKRPVAVYDNEQLIARYHYNSLGERIAKTVYPAGAALVAVSLNKNAPTATTSYSLYQDQRLAAEADSAGRITAHYIYLYGKPVAKIEMTENATLTHRLLNAITPRGDQPGNSMAHLYAIVTDHLGTPQEVLDEQRRPVWQAITAPFGQAQVTYTAAGANGKPFTMNLRLPGQVYDAETGLHYNYYRDYDPALGRYLAPDPLNFANGSNPYGYVSNNPLTRRDPLGLYEEDIHYYMTYFLARAAGVDAQIAYIIATGDQYIDDNPDTRPLDPNYFSAAWDLVFSGEDARHRLATYHFTQQPTNDTSSDPATRFVNPGNAQLTLLFDASIKAGEVGGICAKAQMYGEYLHAFEDTFAHRYADNTPIGVNLGLGHATSGHLPDYTYNSDLRSTDPDTGVVSGPYWPNNEARTLEMEHEVFDRLSSTWGDGKSTSKTWDEIKPFLAGLNGFNAIHESGGDTNNFNGTTESKKIEILNTQLNAWGYKFIDLNNESRTLNLTKVAGGGYDSTLGTSNRNDFLRYNKNDTKGHKAGELFDQADFNGTILLNKEKK